MVIQHVVLVVVHDVILDICQVHRSPGPGLVLGSKNSKSQLCHTTLRVRSQQCHATLYISLIVVAILFLFAKGATVTALVSRGAVRLDTSTTGPTWCRRVSFSFQRATDKFTEPPYVFASRDHRHNPGSHAPAVVWITSIDTSGFGVCVKKLNNTLESQSMTDTVLSYQAMDEAAVTGDNYRHGSVTVSVPPGSTHCGTIELMPPLATAERLPYALLQVVWEGHRSPSDAAPVILHLEVRNQSKCEFCLNDDSAGATPFVDIKILYVIVDSDARQDGFAFGRVDFPSGSPWANGHCETVWFTWQPHIPTTVLVSMNHNSNALPIETPHHPAVVWVEAITHASVTVCAAEPEDAGFSPGHSGGTVDVFVASSQGWSQFDWTLRTGTSASEWQDWRFVALTTDTAANTYATFRTSGNFAGMHFGSMDFAVIKLDPFGNELWRKQVGTSGHETGYSVELCGRLSPWYPCIYLAGRTSGALGAGTTYPDHSNERGDAVIVTLDTRTGTQRDIWQFGTPADDYLIDLLVEGDAIFASGKTKGNFTHASHVGEFDAFVARLNTTGAHIWRRQIGSVGEDSASNMVLDATSTYLYIAGYAAGKMSPDSEYSGTVKSFDCVIWKLWASSGVTVWTRQLGSSALDTVASLLQFQFRGTTVLLATGKTKGNLAKHHDYFRSNPSVFMLAFEENGNEVSRSIIASNNGNDEFGFAAVDSASFVIVPLYTTGAFATQNVDTMYDFALTKVKT
jgi:hypothetical protein